MKNQAFNPYLPGYEYVPDGEPHVFGDRVYIFGSHDRFGGTRYCENDYVCWSAPVDDLSDWRYEGVIYQKTQDPANPKGRKDMWAPDVVQGADGRYYLYYAHNFYNRIAVAVCDTPAGKYQFYGEVKYPDGTLFGKKGKEPLYFDPAVLRDDDGKIYLYTGISPKIPFFHWLGFWYGWKVEALGSRVTQLEADMLTVKTQPQLLIPGADNSAGTGFEGYEFFEASSIRKFGDTYYFVYSTINSHELAYATSRYPDRDFKFGGVLHSNGNIGFRGQDVPSNYWGNNHGSIEYINGKYYVFGHRQTNKNESCRQGVAEVLSQNPDGSFQMAEMTSCGLNGGPLCWAGTYPAGIACVLTKDGRAEKTTVKGNFPYITQDGKDRECGSEQYIANMHDGVVAGFKYFFADTTQARIAVTLRAHRGSEPDGCLEIAADESFSKILAFVPATSIAEKTVSAACWVPTGKLALYFRYEGEGAVDFISFTLSKESSL